MKTNLLIFGTKNFNNSLEEIKDNLGFSLIYYDVKKTPENSPLSFTAVLVDEKICKEENILNIVNKIINKPILFLGDQNLSLKCKYNEKTFLPISLLDLKSKIINLITTYKFNENSSVKIKDYTLDKNEKN